MHSEQIVDDSAVARAAASEALKSALRARLEDAKRANWQTYIEIYDLALVISLVDQDISAFGELISSAPTAWHKQFHARYLAILLCDAADRLPGLLGSGLKSIRDLEIAANWTMELGRIRKRIVEFSTNNSKMLRAIRNNVGAHRNKEALTQLKLMASLDPNMVHGMAVMLSDAIVELIVFYTQLLKCIQNEGFMLRYGLRQIQKNTGLPLTRKHA